MESVIKYGKVKNIKSKKPLPTPEQIEQMNDNMLYYNDGRKVKSNSRSNIGIEDVYYPSGTKSNKTFNDLHTTNNMTNVIENNAKHLERVNNKILNMRMEKLNKIQAECPFQPNVNNNINSMYFSAGKKGSGNDIGTLPNYMLNRTDYDSLIPPQFSYSKKSKITSLKLNKSSPNVCINTNSTLKSPKDFAAQEIKLAKEKRKKAKSQNDKRINRINDGKDLYGADLYYMGEYKSAKTKEEEKLRVNSSNDKEQQRQRGLKEEEMRNKMLEKEKEKIKKYFEDYTFKPNITYNDKYQIKSTFDERNKKSIENFKNKGKLKEIKEKEERHEMNKKYGGKANYKDVVNRLYFKEAPRLKEKAKQEKKEREERIKKKREIINWEKLHKQNNNKYTDSKNYKPITVTEALQNAGFDQNDLKTAKNSNEESLIEKLKTEHKIGFKKEGNFASNRNSGDSNIKNGAKFMNADLNRIITENIKKGGGDVFGREINESDKNIGANVSDVNNDTQGKNDGGKNKECNDIILTNNITYNKEVVSNTIENEENNNNLTPEKQPPIISAEEPITDMNYNNDINNNINSLKSSGEFQDHLKDLENNYTKNNSNLSSNDPSSTRFKSTALKSLLINKIIPNEENN